MPEATIRPACWSWPVPDDPSAWQPDYSHCTPRMADQLRELHRDVPGLWETSLLDWWQDGRCAVCGIGGTLVTDHDHGTGLVRGYLCQSCNTREGTNRGPHCTPWEQYRQRHPTSILGITLRYINPRTYEEAQPNPEYGRKESYEERVRNSPLRGIGL